MSNQWQEMVRATRALTAGDALRAAADAMDEHFPDTYPELVTLEPYASEEDSTQMWTATVWQTQGDGFHGVPVVALGAVHA